MNAMKTFGLLTVLTVLVVAAGQLLGGTRGAVIALIVAAVMNLGSYWFSDRLVLMRYRAREVPQGRLQRLDAIVDRLVARSGLPRPRLFVIPSPQPNAFATGRDPAHAAVAVTEGLLHAMNDDELEGVIAHELAHVKHRDILIGSIAATLAGAVMLLATMARWGAIFGGFERDRRDGGLLGLLALAFVAPLAATLVQLAVSRSREFAADRGAAEMVGHPHGLASALRKLGQMAERVPMDASPASAHMFIVSPLSGRGSLLGWFSTHPPITARIERLLGPGR
jgi:heat shock protein HtpX